MRIGLMGGTFDPPHLGHVVPVEVAAAQFSLDLIWFIPTYIPPHKQREDLTEGHHRAAMIALALQRYPKFLFSAVELQQASAVFTVETIRHFKKDLTADDRLFFLMGSDSFLELHSWHAPRELLQLCELIIITRGSSPEELKENLEQLERNLQLDLRRTIHFANTPYLPISSSFLRSAILQNKNVSEMLSPEVEAYIRKQSLYQRR